MEDGYSIQKLLVLRKLTKAISTVLREQMDIYLSTLAPLLRPRLVLGDYVASSTKESVRGAEKNFRELQSLYDTVATTKPFNLGPELKPPVEIVSTAIEVRPLEYAHTATTETESKTVTVTSPLTWVLFYSGFELPRLKQMVGDRNRSLSDLREFVVHYMIMHVVMTKQTGVTQMLETLHFPIQAGNHLPVLGGLPITYLKSSISTIRPPDNVIIESTEISGMNVFEEVINIDDIVRLRDPLKERLFDIVRSQAPDLIPASAS